MVFSCSTSFGANYWNSFYGKTAPSKLPMAVNVDNYTIFTLNQAEIQAFFSKIGTDPNQALEITLPAPDNTMRTFKIWKTPIFEKELADKHPEIQTFTAYADGDHNVTAKLDYTPYGFRAMVLDGNKSYLIDPYSKEADGYYLAYYQKDLSFDTNLNGCSVGTMPGLDLSNEINLAQQRNANKKNGSQRHTYRLAISCTGEYAASVAGSNPTTSQVLSIIASTINRVNGVYEKELSVTMNIIAGNEAIIYTNAATDPYTCNSNLDCLIGEAQSNITGVIGANNFDVGHILATAGGGLAQLNSVCRNSGKASGCSSSSGPNNIHVILHELGHQFGANHTFSANTGGCDGNGNSENNYEPGSGSTIMSYGGLCNPNNVTGTSDDYFGIASLVEINAFLTGNGSTCGTIATGIAPVTFPEITDTFVIPLNTPFELTAPLASSVQPTAAITYNWEQYDLGNFGTTEANNSTVTEGTIFRSYLPTAKLNRVYPLVDYILDNTYSAPGERLPNVARNLNFKLTARSVFQGWGTFNYMDNNLVVNVAPNAEFRVTGPSTNETWNPGEVKTISWSKGGTGDNPINCGYVNIYLSLDNGVTFPYLIVSNAPNTGTYNYTVYDVYTTKGRIKVKGTGTVFMDIGKGQLNITGTQTSLDNLHLGENISVYPNPATDFVQLENKATSNKLKVTMYGILGNRTWEGTLQEKLSIPTSGMARGQYVIQVIDEQTGVRSNYKVVLK